MIVGFVSKGMGILVVPAVGVPIVAAAVISDLLFPGQHASEQMWVPGVALCISAVLLFVAIRYFKRRQCSASPPQKPTEYQRFERHAPKADSQFESKYAERFDRDFDAGWFMLIPTPAWPYLIGALGLFILCGSIIEAVSNQR